MSSQGLSFCGKSALQLVYASSRMPPVAILTGRATGRGICWATDWATGRVTGLATGWATGRGIWATGSAARRVTGWAALRSSGGWSRAGRGVVDVGAALQRDVHVRKGPTCGSGACGDGRPTPADAPVRYRGFTWLAPLGSDVDMSSRSLRPAGALLAPTDSPPKNIASRVFFQRCDGISSDCAQAHAVASAP